MLLQLQHTFFFFPPLQSLHVYHMLGRLFSGYFTFFLQFKNMTGRLIGGSALNVGVSVQVHGSMVFQLVFLCGRVMDWRSVQDAPHL